MSLSDLDQGAERDHLTFGITRLKTGDVFRAIAKGSIGLGNDLEGAAEAVEVIQIKGAEINLHRLEEILQWNALLLGFDAIDVGVELRHVDGEG